TTFGVVHTQCAAATGFYGHRSSAAPLGWPDGNASTTGADSMAFALQTLATNAPSRSSASCAAPSTSCARAASGAAITSARTAAITCSAIGTACTPRVLLTAMPRANSSLRHNVSTATAEVWTHFTPGAVASSGALRIHV